MINLQACLRKTKITARDGARKKKRKQVPEQRNS
jgi:hypothetical protein